MFLQFSLILIILALAAWLINNYFNSAGYFLAKLPEEYASTPTLNRQILASRHQIKPLFTGGKVKDINLDSLHQVTVIQRMDEQRSEESNTVLDITYYRLDQTGKLIDSLFETSADEDRLGTEFAGYLMYPDHYTAYLISGGLEKHPYIESNRDLTMDQQRLRTLLTQKSQASAVVYANYTMDEGKPKDFFIFVIDQQLHRVFVKQRDAYDLGNKYTNKNYVQVGPITVYDYDTSRPYDWKSKNTPIHLDYFLKQEYHGATSPSFMSPAPMSRPENWEGIAYFSIPFANDTLRFKHPMYYYPNKDWKRVGPYYENNQWGKLDFFKIPGASFQILTVGFDTGNRHDLDGCYLIIDR